MTQEEKDKLLEEAKRRYPIGTVFIPVHVKEGKNKVTGNHKFETDYSDSIIVDSLSLEDEWTACIHKHGEWAEIVSKPEEQLQFEVGKWYKDLNHQNNNHLYIKFKEYSEGEGIYSSECISPIGEYRKKQDDYWIKNNPRNWVLLTDLSEIQPYLPDGHPDKIVKAAYYKCIKVAEPKYFTLNKIYDFESGIVDNGQKHSYLEIQHLKDYGNEFELSTKEAYDTQQRDLETCNGKVEPDEIPHTVTTVNESDNFIVKHIKINPSKVVENFQKAIDQNIIQYKENIQQPKINKPTIQINTQEELKIQIKTKKLIKI